MLGKGNMMMIKESSLSGNVFNHWTLEPSEQENDFIKHKNFFQVSLPFQSTSQMK